LQHFASPLNICLSHGSIIDANLQAIHLPLVSNLAVLPGGGKKKAELKARPSPTGRYEDDARLSHHRLQKLK